MDIDVIDLTNEPDTPPTEPPTPTTLQYSPNPNLSFTQVITPSTPIRFNREIRDEIQSERNLFRELFIPESDSEATESDIELDLTHLIPIVNRIEETDDEGERRVVRRLRYEYQH